MRRLILNIHLVIGLIAGVFVIVLGGTGSILAFEPELDRLLHRDTSYVKAGGRTLSLVEVGRVISRAYPGEPIVAYLLSTEANSPTQAVLSRGIVSVNPYTGEILGIRTRGQSFLGLVRALHVRLATGDVGRFILKWCSVAILISLFSGLYLWWPVKRMRIGGTRWSARFWYDLHSSVGFYMLLPTLVLAGTGTVIGFEDQAAVVIDKLTGSRATDKHPVLIAPKAETDASEISPDEAVQIASAHFPGAMPYRVQMPGYGGFYVIALQDRQNRVTGKRNFIALDPSSGRIESAHVSADLTFRDRFMAANAAIHNCTIWGLPSRIVGAVASILLPLQAVSGLLIWLRRKGILRTR